MDSSDSSNSNEYSIRLLDHIESKKLESLDTLVYSSSLFIIPINVAALNSKFLLMNLYIFIALTSWAHHACRHMKTKECIYDDIDRFACISLGVFMIFYTFFYKALREFIITIIGIFCILLCYYRVLKNKKLAWYNRGIKNWKLQKPHIGMHIAAVLTGSYVALI
jgi:hypothetical protein